MGKLRQGDPLFSITATPKHVRVAGTFWVKRMQNPAKHTSTPPPPPAVQPHFLFPAWAGEDAEHPQPGLGAPQSSQSSQSNPAEGTSKPSLLPFLPNPPPPPQLPAGRRVEEGEEEEEAKAGCGGDLRARCPPGPASSRRPGGTWVSGPKFVRVRLCPRPPGGKDLAGATAATPGGAGGAGVGMGGVTGGEGCDGDLGGDRDMSVLQGHGGVMGMEGV